MITLAIISVICEEIGGGLGPETLENIESRANVIFTKLALDFIVIYSAVINFAPHNGTRYKER